MMTAGKVSKKKQVAVNILLCLAYWGLCGVISIRVPYSWGFLGAAVLNVVFGCLGVRGSRILTYFLILFFSLAVLWPSMYQKAYPNNGLGEDLFWNVYDAQAVLALMTAAILLTVIFWILNRKLRQAGILGRKDGGRPGRRAAVYVGSLVILAAAVSGVGKLYGMAVSPRIERCGSSPYEYLAQGYKDEGAVLINEKGEDVLRISYHGYLEFKDAQAYSDTYLFSIQCMTGDYLVSDSGKILSDACMEYRFLEKEELVLARQKANEMWGAFDTKGREVIPFRYETEEELLETEKLDGSGDEKNYERPFAGWEEFDGDDGRGITNERGEVIVPPQYFAAGFATNGSGYLWADAGWMVTSEEGEHLGGRCLYNQQGEVVFPEKENRGIWPDCENGWYLVEEGLYGDTDIYFLDKNLKTALEMGEEYRDMGCFKKSRS